MTCFSAPSFFSTTCVSACMCVCQDCVVRHVRACVHVCVWERKRERERERRWTCIKKRRTQHASSSSIVRFLNMGQCFRTALLGILPRFSDLQRGPPQPLPPVLPMLPAPSHFQANLLPTHRTKASPSLLPPFHTLGQLPERKYTSFKTTPLSIWLKFFFQFWQLKKSCTFSIWAVSFHFMNAELTLVMFEILGSWDKTHLLI